MTRRPFHALARTLAALAGALAMAGAAHGLTCTSIATGDWGAQTTWGPAGTGCAGAPGGIPGVAEDVDIADLKHTVTISDARSAKTVELKGGTQFTTLLIASGASLNVADKVQIKAPTAIALKQIRLVANSSMTVGDNLEIDGGNAFFRLSEVRVEGASTLTVGNDLKLGNNTRSQLTFTGAGTLNLGHHMKETGTYSFATSTLNLTGSANQDLVAGIIYANITDSKTGGTGRLEGSASINGNITNSGRLDFTANNPTVSLVGGANQTITGTTAFRNLTLNKPAGSVTLNSDISVEKVLSLTSGSIVTGANTVITDDDCPGSVTRPAPGGFVDGNLRLKFPKGTPTCTFHLGSGGRYAPATIAFTVATGAGTMTGSTTSGDHPQVTSPPVAGGTVDVAKSVNRYWTLANGGLSGTFSATFTFVAADLDAGANTANFIIDRYNGSLWNGTGLGTRTATTTQATGVTQYGDFAIGEPIDGFTAIPGDFNAFDTTTPAGSVRGSIQTKRSGVLFTLRLVRVNAGRDAVDTTYAQAGVTVELLDSSNNAGALTVATACRASWVAIAGTSQLVAFAAGVVNASFTVPNSYRDVRVRVTKAGAGAGTGCSTDRFAIRPASLTLSAHDATWRTAGTARTLANTGAIGGNVHAASESAAPTPRPFTLRASPQPVTATNYDGSPSVVSGFPACIAPPAGCVSGLLQIPAPWTAAGGGVRENATAHYTEAGVFNLQLEDQTYANVDLVDGTPAATRIVPSTASASVGRFVPDRFTFSGANSPAFRTYDASCTNTRSFTYIGAPFWYLSGSRPSATVNAVNAAGTITANYSGTLFKLAGGITETYSSATGPALDSSFKGSPTLTAGAGTGAYSAAAGGVLAYTRSTTSPVPVINNPFTANISLSVAATDNNEVGPVGNPLAGELVSSTPLVFNGGGPGIAFDAGAAFRYGIMKLGNAVGSEKLDLPLPLETQYWTGIGFLRNSADHCTSISLANVTFPAYYGGLNAGNMPPGNVTVGGAFAAGVGSLSVKKPLVAATGAVDVSIDLSTNPPAPGENKTWLQLLRSSPPGSYTQDPLGRAAFGIYGSQPSNFIFFRENY